MNESIEWLNIEMHEIKSCSDPLLSGTLDIYQKSFPVEEQMLISFFLNVLRDKESEVVTPYRLQVLAHDGEVAGLVFYEVDLDVSEDKRGAYLWYIASNPDMRGLGIGKILYDYVLRTVFDEFGCRLLCFEIEEAEDALQRHGKDAADFAVWRKAWYKRQGALELGGTRYLCGVGWQPPLPMQVMIHPNGMIAADEALEIARVVQDESIEIIGELILIA